MSARALRWRLAQIGIALAAAIVLPLIFVFLVVGVFHTGVIGLAASVALVVAVVLLIRGWRYR